jgi:hypothetical protein
MRSGCSRFIAGGPAPAASGFASALRPEDSIEADGRNMEHIRPTVDAALDIEIAATPAAVFAALTRDIGGWWDTRSLLPGLAGCAWTRGWRAVREAVGDSRRGDRDVDRLGPGRALG